MPHARVTVAALGLERDERKALTDAGLVAGDLAHMAGMDVVAATGEAIAEARANYLVAWAGLIGAGLSRSFAAELLEHGLVRGRADLASASPDDLLVRLFDVSARTQPTYHDNLSRAVYLARTDTPSPERLPLSWWTKRRADRGFDPLLMYWRHLHGDGAALPRPTGARLLLPTLKVSAPIFEGDIDSGDDLVRPLGQNDVVRNAGPLRLLLGHWMWQGGHGAFARLEDLRPGDGVRVDTTWFAVTEVVKVPHPASLDAADETGVVLATPPHRRVGVIGTRDMVEPVERATLRVVVQAAPADGGAVDTEARPVRRIPGAY